MRPKLEQFIKTFETVWTNFNESARGTDDFQEASIVGYFQHLLLERKLKPSTCCIYRAQIEVMFAKNCGLVFTDFFPNVNAVLVKMIKEHVDPNWNPEPAQKLWKFCHYIMKFKDFQKDDILHFFRDLASSASYTISVQTLNCYRLTIASMYYIMENKDFFKKFPKVDHYVTRLINEQFRKSSGTKKS